MTTTYAETTEPRDETGTQRTIEDALSSALVAMREAQVKARGATDHEFVTTWMAEILEQRPLVVAGVLNGDSTEVWLLEPHQDPESRLVLHTEVVHLDQEIQLPGQAPSTDWGSAVWMPVTKAVVDALEAIDWLRKDTRYLP